MNIFIIGGTGFLGYAGSLELIRRDHFIKCLSLPDKKSNIKIPKEMSVIYNDYNLLSDQEIKTLMTGCDVFVFASGVDERFNGKSPIYEIYQKYNIDPIKRLVPIAKSVGIRQIVIFGSYFAYFDRKFSHLKLSKNHLYIQSRVEQEKVAMSYQDKLTNICVLEFPYVFGVQKGRKPVWVILIDMIKNMKLFTYYPKGGTTMITLNQAGQFIADAVEKNRGANLYPVGYYNLSWDQMLKIFHKYMNIEKRKIIHIPKFIYKLSILKIKRKNKRNGIESGLNLLKLTDIMYNKFYISKSSLAPIFNIKEDNLESNIANSVLYSVEVLKGHSDYISMRVK